VQARRTSRSNAAAAPPCISGRTSYLQVRLAFHLYPQVIPQFCNTGGFGPRRGLTPASPCPWVAHLVSGRILATGHRVLAHSRPLQTRFRSGSSALPRLNLAPTGSIQQAAATIHSPDHSTKGTPSGSLSTPKRPKTPPSDCLSVQGFRGSFIPLPGCFSPFPHGTGSLSVARSIRALEGGPPSFPQGFSCPVVLRNIGQQPHPECPLRDSHPLRWAFPDPSRTPHPVAVTSLARCPPMPSQPRTPRPLSRTARFGRQPGSLATTTGLSPALPAHRSEQETLVQRLTPLLLILLPRSTEMFQFLRCPPPPHSRWSRPFPDEGLPHSDSAGSSLACSSPATFRRAPRPSSAPGP
jgi:hypothetical protein